MLSMLGKIFCRRHTEECFLFFPENKFRNSIPASILYKSTAGRYRPVSYPDGPITARYIFIKNAYWVADKWHLFVCVEVLRPSQPNGVMSSAVSLPNHTFTGLALSSKRLTSIVHILSPETDNCPS